ncbi:MAG: hypothetical protein FJW35_05350, partial [Acidobacteria bacterium]|nr:hypothetical protein [Acidobacteriota bacterium]
GAWILLPALAFGAEGSGDRWGFWLFGAGRFFNLALVVAVLVWAAGKPLANFFENRSQSIRRQLQEARKARAEAEAKLAEMEARMSALSDAVREVREEAEEQAREERRRLTEEAGRDAEKIIDRAGEEIRGLTRAAHLELRRHAADLSVKLAESRIRSEIGDEDRKRMFAGFVDRLGARG